MPTTNADGIMPTNGVEDTSPGFLFFHEMEAKSEAKRERVDKDNKEADNARDLRAVNKYLNSNEFKIYEEGKVKVRIAEYKKTLHKATADRAKALKEKLIADGSTRGLQDFVIDMLVSMCDGQSTCGDLIFRLQTLIERGVYLCACEGSVASYCVETREEIRAADGRLLPAVPLGIRFRASPLDQPPRYISAREASTPGPGQVIYEYSDELAHLMRGRDF